MQADILVSRISDLVDSSKTTVIQLQKNDAKILVDKINHLEFLVGRLLEAKLQNKTTIDLTLPAA